MNRLRELREEKGLTQQEVAERFKVSASAIGMYEQGRRVPSADTLADMAIFFDANIEYIIGKSPIRLRPSVKRITDIHSETIQNGYIEERFLNAALQDDEGREMLKRMIKEKLVEINFSDMEYLTAKSLGKMLSSVKNDDTKKIKLEIIRTIIEIDFTTEQLQSFNAFLKSFVGK